MTVIQDCLCGTVGRGLGDIEVCEMLETVLTTCCQMRLSGTRSYPFCSFIVAHRHSETLRRSAETTMHTLVRTVFSKLHELDPEEEEAKLQTQPNDDENEGELKMSVITQGKAPAKELEDPSEARTDETGHSDEKTLQEKEPEPVVEEAKAPETPHSPARRPECACY